MAKIDRLLSLVLDQGANELRLGTDREPRMLAYGSAKRLALPSMDAETVRDLLGDVLTPERQEALEQRGRVEGGYEAAGLGTFAVSFTSRADGFDVVFRKSSAQAIAAAAAAPASVAAGPASGAVRAAEAAPASTRGSPVDAGVPAAGETMHGLGLMQGVGAAVVDASVVPRSSARDLGSGAAVGASPLLAELVAHAAARRASDVHFSEGAVPMARIDGKLAPLEVGAVDFAALLPLGDAEATLARSGSLDLGLEVPHVGRVRAHVFRADGVRAASIRLLPQQAPSLSSLHFPIPLDDLVALPHGLVLVCGAAGSGKSTTLAALAQEALRRRSIVLVTLEDPIEYALAPTERSVLRRRQVGRDVGDFARGLRDALREDPDVILIGEMRDPETIGLALTAAETGHLVFATLHSRSAASAVERIVDAYPPERATQIRTQLADSLRAVVAQRLVPRANGSGRVPALEVLRVNHAVASMIRESKTAQVGSVIQSSRREGMITLERCLADRVAAGEIRLEDARAAANDPASLAMQMQR
ncbi:MAG: PilT/PilU family type 4a pilus ATPase [Labilithrix sp.]|nr:PilT/PilU family type 4a pilus ATPase [Labilithrix sp.]MCW5811192.1 PilT/PilU family type 4a pilus ATPase [Labilithrix sp.]